jgi:hypothetical protein
LIVDYSITWTGHWFQQRIFPFTWFGHTDFDYWFLRLIWGARRVRPVGRGCLLLHGSDVFGGPCTPILWFVFPFRLTRLITDRYFCHFIVHYLDFSPAYDFGRYCSISILPGFFSGLWFLLYTTWIFPRSMILDDTVVFLSYLDFSSVYDFGWYCTISILPGFFSGLWFWMIL